MIRALAAVVLLALAGCGGPPDTSPQAQCGRRADDDPQVRALLLQRTVSGAEDLNLAAAYQRARRQAVQRCLAGQGLAPSGGVEPTLNNPY